MPGSTYNVRISKQAYEAVGHDSKWDPEEAIRFAWLGAAQNEFDRLNGLAEEELEFNDSVAEKHIDAEIVVTKRKSTV
jgi:hypothetical protein